MLVPGLAHDIELPDALVLARALLDEVGGVGGDGHLHRGGAHVVEEHRSGRVEDSVDPEMQRRRSVLLDESEDAEVGDGGRGVHGLALVLREGGGHRHHTILDHLEH